MILGVLGFGILSTYNDRSAKNVTVDSLDCLWGRKQGEQQMSRK